MRLEGKVAVVTGGGTGIGAATARLFAAEGATVVVTGRREAPLRKVADAMGGLAITGDMADPEHPAAVVEETTRTFGGVDVVIANAGAGYPGNVAVVDDEGWQRTFDVNVTGPLRLVRASIGSMIERGGGSIVLVSSVNGLRATVDSASYGTSKTALIGLMRSIAVDFGPRGIRANAVCPGWVLTPMGDREMDGLASTLGVDREQGYRLATQHVPLRRPATPEEIADCCLFLASEASSIVTGAVLVADGGQTAVDLGGILFAPREA
ncbi:MAG TPA: SDR family oxidoreductase [Actinomycetota bacterium]|nr:SDR family oxidoreductase [Actinomycetota bacterium]